MIKHSFHYYLLIISFGVMLTSCEEEFILKEKDFKPSIVLNSIFTSDTAWVLTLNTSRNILDPESVIKPIVDAKVIISQNSGQTLCELVHIGNGVYKGEWCNPSPENTFNVYVNSSLYGSVSASSRMPARAKVSNVEFSSTGEDRTRINFSIEDKSLENNFYIWSLVDIPTEVAITKPTDPKIQLDITKWVKEINDNINSIKGYRITSDFSAAESPASTINTSLTANNDLIVDRKDLINASIDDKPKSVTYLRILTVSDELFKYYKSIENYLQYEGKNSSVNESEYIYSNVNGGIGVFAGYTVQYIEIEKK